MGLMIRIKRESGLADKFRKYKVVLDGYIIGTIKDGEQVEFEVAAGKHELFLAINKYLSNKIDFETDGGLVDFECGCNLRGKKLLLLAPPVMMFLPAGYLCPEGYLWLKETKKDEG